MSEAEELAQKKCKPCEGGTKPLAEDGVKAYLGEIGWVMLRASGTEPMLRIYAETSRPETTRRILDETSARVRKM